MKSWNDSFDCPRGQRVAAATAYTFLICIHVHTKCVMVIFKLSVTLTSQTEQLPSGQNTRAHTVAALIQHTGSKNLSLWSGLCQTHSLSLSLFLSMFCWFWLKKLKLFSYTSAFCLGQRAADSREQVRSRDVVFFPQSVWLNPPHPLPLYYLHPQLAPCLALQPAAPTA